MALYQRFYSLDKTKHLVKSFDCGKPIMNDYLVKRAAKHQALGLSRTMVLPIKSSLSEKKAIAAYYTLASITINSQTIPIKQNLPRTIPAVLLARLAIALDYQSKGLGSKVLIHALRHAYQLSEQGLPAYALVLDVLDNEAYGFYENFDFFEPMQDDPMRLFISMKSLKRL